MARAVITTIGTDRPGLVAELSSAAQTAGLNIEDSRMTILGGEFAILMSVEGSADALNGFETNLKERAGESLAYLFRRTDGPSSPLAARSYIATLSALDHPGIVASIATFFSQRQINIRDLNTETTPAPHTGIPMFRVHLSVEIPLDQRIHDLKEAFDAFCADGDLDGTLEVDI